MQWTMNKHTLIYMTIKKLNAWTETWCITEHREGDEKEMTGER
jgi:hypothetical protein